MAKWEMSDQNCVIYEGKGMRIALLAKDMNMPLHIVRECLLKGFDAEAARLDAE